ncbi:deoxyhypusine synthase [Caldisphaera lagunensis DSM 15908]|uniref:Deoxyhypusine synthase n=1 Tax=Caldisphaera lagunensis (strain DSM 15908 / JCM 11604 / ANMR 0165 / IC-154) TaxID=1056495 RepID=L0ACG5_CALLD|nr:deoxyhypusine synthase [Caldisphaera lagunensis]AFZ71099.1 deoxyhypusine synthase [Caldisphaera lagunensis DSM 15908]
MEVKPVRDVRIDPNMPIEKLIEAYGEIYGFMAGHLYESSQILKEGLKESDIRILTFTGNLVSTGLRGILSQLIEKRIFNVIITTCGTLDHDIARSNGGVYYQGYFESDDESLYKNNIHRLGNIFIKVEDYGLKVEEFVRKLVKKAVEIKDEWGIHELLNLAGGMIEDEYSILRAAKNSNADIFVPGWPDGAFGTDLFMESQRYKNFKINYFIDMKKLSDIFFNEESKATALIIGGGISKHHAIWWSQFKNGLDYVVYLTTASEWDGSLSGAMPKEAITWGKVKPKAKKSIVYGDATITLPILAASLLKIF